MFAVLYHMKYGILVAFFFGIAELVNAQNTVGQLLAQWEMEPALKTATWSFNMVRVEDGNTIASRNPDTCLPLASGMKAITTLAAYEVLGKDFRWETTLKTDGILTDSILNGNLILHGYGDPTLGSSRITGSDRFDTLFRSWAATLYASGIRVIQGRVLTDLSSMDNDPVPGSWNWDDIGQYYGAGCYATNIFENTYTLYYSSTSSKTRIDSIFPTIDGMEVTNDVTVSGSRDNAFIYGAPGDLHRRVTGYIPANRKAFEVDGSMPDPPAFAVQELKKALTDAGIEIRQSSMTEKAQTKVLISHLSPVLDSVIWHTNRKSINLYAESILKTMAWKQTGTGSYTSGFKAVRSVLSKTGANMDGFNMEDGSGLSRLNAVSSAQMTAFLSYAYRQPFGTSYLESLSVSGVSGTLKNITGGTVAEGKVFAKSGSMQKVRSYSGFVQASDGKLYAFCIIVNNYNCSSSVIRKKLEDLMVAMVRYAP